MNTRILILIFAFTVPALAAEVGHLRVVASDVQVDDEVAHFGASLDVELGDEVEAALHNGVPITLSWELELRQTGQWAGVIESVSGTWRLSYRPLSRHYSLAADDGGRARSFPALEPLLSELSTVSLDFPRPENSDQVLGRYRIRLEIGALPPPLRLPGYLSEAWRLDSGWVSSPSS